MRHGLAEPSHGHQHRRQVVVIHIRIRVQAQRSFKMGHGLLIPPLIAEFASQFGVQKNILRASVSMYRYSFSVFSQ